MGKIVADETDPSGRRAPEGYRSLATPVYRGSTTLFPSAAAVTDEWDQERVGYTYGLYGTPTALELAARICETRRRRADTILTPGGQSAISLIDLALLRAGDHVLVPRSVYRPNRQLTTSLLARFGVRDDVLRSAGSARGIDELMSRSTRLVWTESPGSVTMEVQDVPAIAAAAHARGATRRSRQHVVGRRLLRCVRARRRRDDAGAHEVRGRSQRPAARARSPFATTRSTRSSAPRGRSSAARSRPTTAASRCAVLQTLGVRLGAIEASALEVARWLAARSEVERVLHPALPSCPGHEFWERDFTGSSGRLLGRASAPGPTREQVSPSSTRCELFEIGYSWAGTTSLAVAYTIRSGPRAAAIRPSARAFQHWARVDGRSHRRHRTRASGPARLGIRAVGERPIGE